MCLPLFETGEDVIWTCFLPLDGTSQCCFTNNEASLNRETLMTLDVDRDILVVCIKHDSCFSFVLLVITQMCVVPPPTAYKLCICFITPRRPLQIYKKMGLVRGGLSTSVGSVSYLSLRKPLLRNWLCSYAESFDMSGAEFVGEGPRWNIVCLVSQDKDTNFQIHSFHSSKEHLTLRRLSP